MEKEKGGGVKRPVMSIAILSTLNGLMGRFNKMYCFPSQIKLLSLLADRCKVKRSRSTLNRHLRALEDEGLIRRVRRIRRSKEYGMMFRSTLYEITLHGYRVLKAVGIPVYKQINTLMKIMGHGPPKQSENETPASAGVGLESLKNILGGLKILSPT